MKALWRTTIHIWTEYDPQDWEIAELARDATDGMAYCSQQKAEYIRDPVGAGLQTEFFDDGGEDDLTR